MSLDGRLSFISDEIAKSGNQEDQMTEGSRLLNGDRTTYGSHTVENGHNKLTNFSSEVRRPHETHRRMLSFAETVSPITLTWRDINVYASVKATGFCGRTYNTGEVRQLLSEVNGIARPGRLLAVMGASGSGKSVLLSTLTKCNLGNITVEGDVRMNGQHVNNSFKALSAFIQQEDLFVGTMKVHEHLWFHAQLRMDAHIPLKDRATRIQEVMTEMGLQKCANTTIGIPGTVKGISGGEMKRLSFASEVLTNPPLLICDEPTSGLDAFMAENVIQTLRAMAKKGKTIIVSIHQPSSEVFSCFDDLLLMASGKVAYFGPLNNALQFFQSSGYPCPPNYNPADHYINSLAVQPDDEEACLARQRDIVMKYKSTEEYRSICLNIGHVEANRDVELLHLTEQHELNQTSPYKASWWTQLRALTWRCWLTQIRDFNVSAVRMVQTFALALLLGCVFLQQKLTEKGVTNINGAINLLVANTSYANVFSVINAFPTELRIFNREHRAGMYRVDSYFLAKNLSEVLLYMLIPSIFIFVDYWMVGLRPGVEHFFIAWITLLLICKAAISFGYFISTWAGRVDICVILASPIMQTLWLFTGFMLNLSTVPLWIGWIQYLSWFKHGYEIFMLNQWRGVTNITCVGSLNISTQTAPCFNDGDSVLLFYGFDKASYAFDFCCLLGIIVLLRFGAYLGLWKRARN